MSRSYWALLLAFAIAIAIATMVTGCGGESGSAASKSSAPPSKADYVKQANAACRKAREGLEKEVDNFLKLQRRRKAPQVFYADFAHYALLPTIEDEIRAIRLLRTPAGAERHINYLLYVREAPVNQIAISKKITSPEVIDRRFVKSGKILRAYGLSICARGPEATRWLKGRKS